MSVSLDRFLAARDFLLAHREDYDTASRDFRWPELSEFNWALEYFDGLAGGPRGGQTALWIVHEDEREERYTFAQMTERSNRLANGLRALGVRRGDRVLVMLGNRVEQWDTALAVMKLGAVIVPATPMLTAADLADRFARGGIGHVVADADYIDRFAAIREPFTRISVGDTGKGWHAFARLLENEAAFVPDGPTPADAPLLLYFTSGTTSRPKLVEHTQSSYPVGHLSTLYWLGLEPGDVHCNISSPGWAKHAWSSLFAPWNAEATVFVLAAPRFDPPRALAALARCGVTTLCAPPTVWRLLIQEDLRSVPVRLRELACAGEPLNPEVIEQVRAAWGLTIRDGYGQTETTAQIGNPPGQPVKPGSMGRPLPGYRVVLLDLEDREADEGEIALALEPRPMALMTGYAGDPARTGNVMRAGYYRCGDVASRDADGYITYVGRADDVFKSSGYRISPFELESVLIEHPAVAEAAVVPSPDPVRYTVPKAFVVLGRGHQPGPELAEDILRFAGERLAPYKRIRRLEFGELPKTVSGKIRRVELRQAETAQVERRATNEYREEDFPALRGR